jgi:hypothetical protein
MSHAGPLHMPCKKVVIGSTIKKSCHHFQLQRNLGLTNLKEPMLLFFIAKILLLQGLFTIKLITEGLKIKFFIAEILLLKRSLYRGLSVLGWSGF